MRFGASWSGRRSPARSHATNTCGTCRRGPRSTPMPARSTRDSTRDRGRPTPRSVPSGNWSSCRRCGARCVLPTAFRPTVCTSARGWSAWTAWSPPGRTLLPPILTDAAARRGPVLNLRSRAYQAVGRPTGLDDQTVTLRIRPSRGGRPGSHWRCHRETGSWRGGKPPPVVGGRSRGSPGHRRPPRHPLVTRARSTRRTDPDLDDHAESDARDAGRLRSSVSLAFRSGSNAGRGRPVPGATRRRRASCRPQGGRGWHRRAR